MSYTPEMPEVIRAAIESRLLDLHVALPCVVKSYDDVTQTVDVTPLLKRVLEDESGRAVTEDLPDLPSVPVSFPRSSAFALRFPLEAGDTGLVVFAEVPIDQWLGTPVVALDRQQTPGDARRHTLSGGLFFPGAYNGARRMLPALAAGMLLGSLDPAGVVGVFPGSGGVEFRNLVNPLPAQGVAIAARLSACIDQMLAAGVTAGGPGAANFTAAQGAWNAAKLNPLTAFESSALKGQK